MAKLILKSLLLSILIIPTAFAEEELSPFNQGGDWSYQQPQPEENYIAVRAPEVAKLYRYFGMNLGLLFAPFKPNITTTNTVESLKTNSVNYIIGGFGGLGTNFDRFYIGAELNVNYNTLNRSPVTPTAHTKLLISQPFVTGIDFLPGYLTAQKDLLFYGRLGIGSSLFKFKINDESDSNEKKFAIGWRAGLGVKSFISDNFSINFDYIFTIYNKINKNYTSKTTNTAYSYAFSAPTTHQLSIGFAVNF